MTSRRDDDPFCEEADPYPPTHGTMSRRGAVRLALASPLVIAAACHAPRNLVCAPGLPDTEHCTHRFCRYHSA